MKTEYVIVRIKSERGADFRRVRRALHTFAIAQDIRLADVPVRSDRFGEFHAEVERIFERGLRLTSRPRETPTNT